MRAIKATVIELDGFGYEMKTLGNGSQINPLQGCQFLMTETFWIELQFEIESLLNVKVVSMTLKPADDPRWTKPPNILHIIHEPKVDTELAKMMAHAEVEELKRMHACESVH